MALVELRLSSDHVPGAVDGRLPGRFRGLLYVSRGEAGQVLLGRDGVVAELSESVSCDFFFNVEQRAGWDLERLLKGAEKIVREFGPQLQDFDLAPQHSVYKALSDRAKSSGAHFGRSPKSWNGERFWCPVEAVVNDEADSNRPGVETEGLGFWVRDGMDDLPFICTFGEGYSGN
ncbi:hypothetical protein VTN00DRAFT_2309 [Thermoascus crustaceus]|uniref:uncharacterized protein n=1 Tax=Thermoascus crustaceus TaxID=5088 RepID=UPI003742A0D5